MIATAQSLDSKLDGAAVSDDQRFMISHATHSYYGSTQLLEVAGQPLWVVNEGEYCMMNTLDLAVDHVFWELEHNPWLVRNLLDDVCSPLQLYRRSEGLQVRLSLLRLIRCRWILRRPLRLRMKHSSTAPTTRSQVASAFCHDMGAHNNFSPQGRSSYELANLTGCFSLHDPGAALQLDSHGRLLRGQDP